MKVGIAGGGMMGLTLALRLAQAGHHVTVIEAAPQLGGLATWYDYGEFIWDKYYHVICPSDEHLIGLIRELGLEPRLHFATTRTGFLWQGRHLSMSSNREFLAFPALSLLDKARLAAGILYCQRFADPAPLERIRAADWLRRIFGRRTYEVIWEPLLQSKYGTLKDEMPATLIWATIRRYYATRDKTGGRERLGYLSGGLKSLLDALAGRITRAGGEILTGTPVLALEETPEQTVTVRTQDCAFDFDRVICTMPTNVAEKLAGSAGWGGQTARSQPRFLGVVCLALVLRQPLSPFYVTNLIQKGFPFTGIIGVSNLTGPNELSGRHLAILPRYDLPDSVYFERSLNELTGEFLEALKPFWPDIRQNVLSCHLNRARMVQALWIDGPPPQQPPLMSPSGKIQVINAELTGRDTLNNNAVIRVASEAARDFLAEADLRPTTAGNVAL